MAGNQPHPNTDFDLVREIFAAAAAQAIATPPPATAGVLMRTGGPDFDTILNKAIKAASTHAAYEEGRSREGMDSYLKSMDADR
ncbi:MULTISPECIES: hypothetical protein [Stenotrophomonas]|uniref:hypothetical protein n=1 Tax=Stenotrophomonas TaxID=40323 RepID=UPI0011100B30|nr:hypothetical protein [Stenotrophomonas maltophilia]MDT3502585.1 hypothetical protein [Stenotrophomonas maltophilia]